MNNFDIRTIPVEKLQSRDGDLNVLHVIEDPTQDEDSNVRCVVVYQNKRTLSVTPVRTGIDGSFCKGTRCNSDVVRKKVLKGRVLYKDPYGKYDVFPRPCTEAEFRHSAREAATFVRILTEVPEFPVEEVDA